MTLTEFLTARIDEDEAAVKGEAEMQARFSAAPFTVSYEWARITEHENGAQGTSFAGGCPSPARVLAECEAKRRMIDVARAFAVSTGREYGWKAAENDLSELLAPLALPYADHPDYQQEWAV